MGRRNTTSKPKISHATSAAGSDIASKAVPSTLESRRSPMVEEPALRSSASPDYQCQRECLQIEPADSFRVVST